MDDLYVLEKFSGRVPGSERQVATMACTLIQKTKPFGKIWFVCVRGPTSQNALKLLRTS